MRLKRIIYVLIALCVFTSAFYSQINEGVDPGFIPVISRTPDAVTSTVSAKLQPDGKLLVFGNVLNGVIRYNTDGSLDASFSCSECNSIFVTSVAVQPDGKIIVAGYAPETLKPRIIRINADGSLDPTFSSPLTVSSSISGLVRVFDIQSDGKIYVTLESSTVGFNGTVLYRLNPNGSIDNSFMTLGTNSSSQGIIELKILPDGRIFVFGRTPYGPLAQINDDGSENTSFQKPVFSNSPLQILPSVSSIDLQPNGKLVVAGVFDTVNGISRKNLVRLNTDSGVDLNFNPPAFLRQNQGGGFVRVLSSGKLLFADASITGQSLYRLNSDGSIDNTYTPPPDYDYFSDVDSQDRAYFVVENFAANKISVTRLNPNGTLDSTYNPVLDKTGSVNVLAVQTDGKIIAAGNFERVNGVAASGIARINPDGTIDTSFNPPPSISPEAFKDIVVQADGKILIGGTTGLIRLNADGSLDASFNVNVNIVNTIALQDDGKILIGGDFSGVNGVSRTAVARLNADGSLDTAFNPLLGNPIVQDIIWQTDGKIVFTGSFTGVNGFNSSNTARLNSDGSLDMSFNSNVRANQIIRQPDGKYLLRKTETIVRINADGSADNTFATVNIPTFSDQQIFAMYLQPDGSIVFGGNFKTVNGVARNRIARVFSDGTLDNLFLPSGANGDVRAFAAQSDGQLIVGGSFSKIGNVNRYALARLTLNTASSRTRFDYDGDGRADVSVFRPSNGAWYIQQSTNGFKGVIFGTSTDLIVPADYDGDGKSDIAVFRPSNGTWYYLRSSDGGFVGIQWGQNGDIPIPGDFDRDGRADVNVFRPSDGYWYRLNSSDNQFVQIAFGQNGDIPLSGDFNGDGKADLAVFRPSAGYWYIARPTGIPAQNFDAVPFGYATDIPVPADYDGDGKTDIAVFRPSNGAWYRLNSSTGAFVPAVFGQKGDIPVPADYDGDGKANLAVFRPSANSWYIARPTGTPAQNFDAVLFGASTDKPTPAAFQQ